ncbi:MAG: hypothetical protein JAY65_09930 [Candidatus Thiodiazotropha endolucinida]|nr:hypothetical protein [Candidatus Thiodiazotropha taylori]MCW4279337.1 hypothetical protein [Candidatus Thiodiazotropha taylori]
MVNRLAMPGWSFFKDKVKAVEITRSKVLKLKFNKTQEWEIHGLVFIDPSESAHEMIGRLNAASQMGRRLHAHPYIHREASRDRRRLMLDKAHRYPGDRRRLMLDKAHRYPGDRRREDRRRISLASQVVDAFNLS